MATDANRLGLVVLLTLVGSLPPGPCGSSQAEAGGGDTAALRLFPERPLERRIAGGTTHAYTVELGSGHFARLRVRQQGIDLAVAVFDPRGELFLDVDSPTGRHSTETASWIAGGGGAYRVEVRPLAADGAEGRYEIRLTAPRPATREDHRRVAAEAAELEGHRLASGGTEDERRAALAAYRGALETFTELGDDEARARLLYRVGQLHRRLGELDQALALLGQAMGIYRRSNDTDEEAATFNQLGMVHTARSDFDSALSAYDEALRLWRGQGRSDQAARVLNNRALVFQSVGRPRLALEAYRQARERFRVAGDRRREATALQNLATLQLDLGEPRAALDTHLRALELIRAEGQPELEARFLVNLTLVYEELGELHEALEAASSALARFHELGHGRLEADARINLGGLFARLGRPREAREHFREALRLARETGDRRLEATALLHLGHALAALDRQGESRRLLEDALALHRELGDRPGEAATLETLGAVFLRIDPRLAVRPLEDARGMYRELDDPAGEANSLHYLGQVRAALDEPEAALRHLDQALTLRRALDDPAGRALTFQEIGRVRRDRGELEAARTALEEALRNIEPLRTEVRSLRLRTSYFATLRDAYELLVDVLMQLHRGRPEKGLDRQALAVAERGRARVLLDLLREAGIDTGGGALPEGVVGAVLERLRRELADPAGPPTVVLEYSLGEPRSYLWRLDRDGVTSFELAGRGELRAAALAVHRDLRDPVGGDRFAEEQRRRALAQRLLGPVAGSLRGARLIVVPDDALQVLPFAALPLPAGGPGSDDSETDSGVLPLVMEHEVLRVPSLAVLAELDRRPPPPAAGPVVVVADPVVSRDDPRLESLDQSAATGGGEPRFAALPRVPWSRREAEALAAHAGGHRVRLATGFDADLEFVRGGGLAGARWIHFATHGVVDDERPERSALVLSRWDASGHPQDGDLRLKDLYELELDADLVVLSGCDTALGEEVRGEGLMGLAYGFFHTGASSVMASLWAVQDRATAELMERFYSGLLQEGLSPAAALRRAQISLRQERRWRDPYFWAAFVVQGAPSPEVRSSSPSTEPSPF